MKKSFVLCVLFAMAVTLFLARSPVSTAETSNAIQVPAYMPWPISVEEEIYSYGYDGKRITDMTEIFQEAGVEVLHPEPLLERPFTDVFHGGFFHNGKMTIRMRIVKLERIATTSEIVVALDLLGLKPAYVYDLGQLAKTYPEARLGDVVAMGNQAGVCRGGMELRAPLVYELVGEKGDRAIRLDFPSGDIWERGRRFLAVVLN